MAKSKTPATSKPAATDISEKSALSISGLAKALGSTRETVRARLVAHRVQPVGESRGHPLYSLRDAVEAWLAAERRSRDPDDLQPLERRAYYQGEVEKLALQVKRGEVIPRAEVERVFARAYAVVAQYLDTLPDVVERATASTPEQLRRLEVSVDQLREELYTALVTDPDDADGPARKRA